MFFAEYIRYFLGHEIYKSLVKFEDYVAEIKLSICIMIITISSNFKIIFLAFSQTFFLLCLNCQATNERNKLR